MSPHTMCIPFSFGNVAAARNFIGTGKEQEKLKKEVMGAWIAFAQTGNPNHQDLISWPQYELTKKPTMIFDTVSRVENNPKPEELEVINSCAPFVADA